MTQQIKLEMLVGFAAGAASSGLAMLRQNIDKLKADLQGVRVKQQLGADLLALKAKFNEVSKSGHYSKEATQAVARQVGALAAKAREAGLNVGKLSQELRTLRAAEMGLNLQARGQEWRTGGADQRTEARGKMLEAAAAGYSFYKPLDVAARYDDAVKDIAITGELSRAAEADLAKEIRGLALRYNQEQHNVALANKKLVETGMSQQQARAMMPLMTKTATATRTDSGDAAKMARSFELLGVQDMERGFNIAAAAGKKGSFELRDMAKWFPKLGGAMKELGVKGDEAVTSMSARLQISTRTAGSNDEAANNFSNFLDKLTANDTAKDFSKQGVDLKASLAASAAKGMDPITAGVDLVLQHMKTKAPQAFAELKKAADDVAKIKDPMERAAELERRQGMVKKLAGRFAIADLFQDRQALSYLMAEIQNKNELTGLMAAIKNGRNEQGQNVIDADFARRTEGMAEKMKGLKIAATDLGIAFGNALMPLADLMMPVMKGLSNLLTGFTENHPAIARFAALSLTGVSAMAVLGFAGKFLLGGLMSTVGGLMVAGGWLLRTRMGLAANALATGLYAQALAGLRLRLVAVALASAVAGGPLATLGMAGRGMFVALAAGARAFGLALLGTPIGWIGLAVAGLALVVWKYWQPIKAFAAGLWDGLKTGVAPVWQVLKPALVGLRAAFGDLAGALGPVGRALGLVFVPVILPLKGVLWLLGKLWAGFKWLLTPVQATGDAAKNMGQAFGKGVTGALVWVAELTANVLGWPTKMMHAGAEMVRGLVLGIKSQWASAVDAVMGLGASMRDRFKDLLGIKSPSRVFMGFGESIGAGAELGILSTVGKVGTAVGKLSGVALAGALATGGAMAVPQSVPPLGQFAAVGVPDAQSRQAAISVSFAPVINVTMSGAAGGAEVREQVSQGLGLGQRELEAMLRRLLAEQTRRGY
jgi:Phage-related minor tail protein